jgi:hypothetical protein
MDEDTIVSHGLTATLSHDSDPESPREWCNAGAMVCWHRRYNLGDAGLGYRDRKGSVKFPTPASFHEFWKSQGRGGLLLPLHLYDHSGITISASPFSCAWDSGQVGYIYATRETILKEWGTGARRRISPSMLASARKCLLSEVSTYDQFLTGDVYCYDITTEDDEHLDSCSGFFGHDYALSEMRSALASCLRTLRREAEHRASLDLIAPFCD